MKLVNNKNEVRALEKNNENEEDEELFGIPLESNKDFKRIISEGTRRMNHTLNSEIS